ncbi:hypothetical protein FB451DRAFT_452464 [Mycena latifolia]|nr:hypothetical protein FB451DRAFT_452464 [Mycena latifolia]
MPPKKLKFKEYRIPENHCFLFIKNPWPFDESMSSSQNPQAFCNAVVAWICCMIQDLCDIDIYRTEVQIFWQSTHRDLIADIEVPDDCPNLDAVLGAHHSALFLTDRHAGTGNLTSVVYEYDYKRMNSPQKTNWTHATAKYSSLPKDFAVKCLALSQRSYPTPGPAEKRQLHPTKPLPGRLVLHHPDCPQQTLAPLPQEQTARRRSSSPPEEVQPAAPRSRSPSRASDSRSPSRFESPTPTPAPEPNPRSEFAFTPYERPPNFPRGHTITTLPPESSARASDSVPPRSSESVPPRASESVPPRVAPSVLPRGSASVQPKQDPDEEDAAAVDVLLRNSSADRSTIERGASTLSGEDAPVRVKSEPRAPVIKQEQEQELKLSPEPSASVGRVSREREFQAQRGPEAVPVKQEQEAVTIKQEAVNAEKYGLDPALVAQVEQARRERELQAQQEEGPFGGTGDEDTPMRARTPAHVNMPIKPEPTDVPMPKPRALNRRMDPFEPDDSPGSSKVKQKTTEDCE